MADAEVTFKVPPDRVGALHTLFGQWLDDADLILVPKDAVAQPPSAPWTGGEHDLARAVLRASTPAVIELVATLADTPGAPVGEDALATRCGVSAKGAVSQLIGRFAASCRAVGHPLPIGWVKTSDGVQYWLNEPTLIWRKALQALRKPPTPPAGISAEDVADRLRTSGVAGSSARAEAAAGEAEPQKDGDKSAAAPGPTEEGDATP